MLGIMGCWLLSFAQSEVYAKNGIAVNGYDVVSYFKGSGSAKGKDEYSVNWENVKWLFVSKENAEFF